MTEAITVYIENHFQLISNITLDLVLQTAFYLVEQVLDDQNSNNN